MSGYYDELSAHDEPAQIDGWRHWLEQRLRFEVVRRGLAIDDNDSLVDLGCGTGRLLQYLGPKRAGCYVGVEQRSDAIKRGRLNFPEHTFIESDLRDSRVDDAGPYDFAVAIGTLVDGSEDSTDRTRIHCVKNLIDRLQNLSRRGWALVILNQTVLAANPVRQLEPALKGASVDEVQSLLQARKTDAAIESDALPTDLFVLSRGDEDSAKIRGRIRGNKCHHAVLERSGPKTDLADIAWFWFVSGRLDKARRLIDKVPASHPRKALLSERIANAE